MKEETKQINYIDIGLHRGDEIQMFIDVVNNIKEVDINVSVHGFEAHRGLFESVTKRYSNNENVRILNRAVCDKNNEIVKLYIADGNKMEGNSIYSTKNNVDTNNYIEVLGIKLSDYIKDFIPNYKNEVNIIRFNIEGAELMMMEDLIESGIHKYINLFLGASGTADINKVKEIEGKADYYTNLLKDNDIVVHQFCAAESPNNPNISPRELKMRIQNEL